jgi:hypothetical protein
MNSTEPSNPHQSPEINRQNDNAYQISFPWRGQGCVGDWDLRVNDLELVLTGILLKQFRIPKFWWLTILSILLSPVTFFTSIPLISLPLFLLGILEARVLRPRTQTSIRIALSDVEHIYIDTLDENHCKFLVKIPNDDEYQIGLITEIDRAVHLRDNLSKNNSLLIDSSGMNISGVVNTISQIPDGTKVPLPSKCPKSYTYGIRAAYLGLMIGLLLGLLEAWRGGVH